MLSVKGGNARREIGAKWSSRLANYVTRMSLIEVKQIKRVTADCLQGGSVLVYNLQQLKKSAQNIRGFLFECKLTQRPLLLGEGHTRRQGLPLVALLCICKVRWPDEHVLCWRFTSTLPLLSFIISSQSQLVSISVIIASSPLFFGYVKISFLQVFPATTYSYHHHHH